MNIYIERAFHEELYELAAFLSEKAGTQVTISRALTQAVRSSPEYRAMRRAHGHPKKT